MKKYLATVSVTALISVAPFAMAASSTDLTVTGTITPSACLPTLSGNGVVDYGKISAKDLNQDTNTKLEDRTVTLSVKCDATTKFALKGIDNRIGSSDLKSMFGLGKINGTQNIGRFLVSMMSAVADGVAAQPIKSKDGQTGWHGHLFWMPGDYASVAARDDFSQPISVQDLTLELALQTYIYRADGLDLTNEVKIDGSATLEMKYL
ncbi:DUF1120 domain-containing protein [Pseudomonas izuensis]|uniref:DUF1120 domain-containing protein n=1 Tax=Pseudomonas izuensis TaxID=2684212 RepID=A0ABM7S001_9PSED|nr:DUF1120 domain-containing protein [Pseudomonas izuensis]BCX70353.1 DUF1120 domain-containing protein [Pseudomonas izuensis]